MKKSILVLSFLIGIMHFSYAQVNQSELTPILQDAKDFAEKSNQQSFEYSINQFATWLTVNILKPENLTQANKIVLFEAIKSALKNDLIKDVDKNLILLFEFLKYESENGDHFAMYNLGLMYFEGKGEAQNYTTAKYWYEKASEKGNADAMFKLGSMYDEGKVVPHNNTTAKYWYEKAAEKGNTSAMSNLGLLYQNSEDLTLDQNSEDYNINYTTAKYWYDIAAEKGNDSAMNNLGTLYFEGYGVIHNYTTAIYWYEKAAEKGNATAMFNLGYMYYGGIGVSESYTTAKYWFEKAAEKGDTTAMDYLAKNIVEVQNPK